MEYTLENEVLSVKFVSFGGSLHSIKDREGTEYLWQGDPAYWSGQAPVLFPICGSLRNDSAKVGISGKMEMPRHGIVRKREFICAEQTGHSITFVFNSNEETMEKFPYRFQLAIKYTLNENEIITEYIVENHDQIKMPFQIGGHPGFHCPLLPEESYEDYRIVFEQEETCSVPTPVTETGLIDMEHRTPFLKQQKELPLSHELFAKDAVILDELKSRRVTLCSKKMKKV